MKVGAYGIISSRLIRTDRNGTRYYEGMVKCDRCGGAGEASKWEYTGRVCYKCAGKGVVADQWCERTPEYEAKLDAKRIARLEKQEAERKAHAEEFRLQSIARNCERSEKAIQTCNTRKCHGCETCEHRSYCSLLDEVLSSLEEGLKERVLSDAQNALYERLHGMDRSEPVTIETVDGQPCREGRWFTNRFGSSTRCIVKPNGEKVYTSATTDKGLAKYGLRNRQN